MVFMLREYIYEMFLSNSEPHRCSSFELMWTPLPKKKIPEVYRYIYTDCHDARIQTECISTLYMYFYTELHKAENLILSVQYFFSRMHIIFFIR